MKDNVHIQLFRLFEFSDEEIADCIDDWMQGCKRFGISNKDVANALNNTLPSYWDLSLKGIRLCMGAYLREIIELFRLPKYKERGDTIIYCNMPTHPVPIYANKLAGGDRFHVCQPDFFISSILKPFFNKKNLKKIDQTACLNKSCNHCELNQNRISAQLNGMIPLPTVTWNWGLLCNEGPKSEEFLSIMNQDSSCNYVITSLPHDTCLGVTEAEDEFRVDSLYQRLKTSQERITEYTGISVTEEHMSLAMDNYIAYLTRLDELTRMVKNADPQPIKCNSLSLFSALQHVILDYGNEYFLKAINVLIEECKELIKSEKGILPAGAPKIACHFVPYCTPWLEDVFNDNGINISYSLYFPPLESMLEETEKTSDCYRIVAKQWLHNPSAVNMGNEITIVEDMLRTNPVEGVLFGFFSFDRWIGAIQKTMISILEENTNIPHYYLEGNFWSDSRFTKEDRLSRIENICYHIKINHMMK